MGHCDTVNRRTAPHVKECDERLVHPWCDRMIRAWPWHNRPAPQIGIATTPSFYESALAALDPAGLLARAEAFYGDGWTTDDQARTIRTVAGIESISKIAHETEARIGRVDDILLEMVEAFRVELSSRAPVN